MRNDTKNGVFYIDFVCFLCYDGAIIVIGSAPLIPEPNREVYHA